MQVFKRRDFARWQLREKLPDSLLCEVVGEMEAGLLGAKLACGLYKKRVARPGRGKRGGYRTLLSARVGDRYVFLHGFPKNRKDDITSAECNALQFASQVFLALEEDKLAIALVAGVLSEVHCGEIQHH